VLAARLLQPDAANLADAWNFGPESDACVDVVTIANHIRAAWGKGGPDLHFGTAAGNPHEAGVLRLDSSKAKLLLGWRPRLSVEAAATMTADWYRAFAGEAQDMRAFSEGQIEQYAGSLGVVHEREITQCA
jgi:CDP-glucose 4,6-dehydratase